ncbi:hypothetical protein CBL_05643 [Carabus blaptoides fortunei]
MYELHEITYTSANWRLPFSSHSAVTSSTNVGGILFLQVARLNNDFISRALGLKKTSENGVLLTNQTGVLSLYVWEKLELTTSRQTRDTRLNSIQPLARRSKLLDVSSVTVPTLHCLIPPMLSSWQPALSMSIEDNCQMSSSSSAIQADRYL